MGDDYRKDRDPVWPTAEEIQRQRARARAQWLASLLKAANKRR